jgi:hypothetical protein
VAIPKNLTTKAFELQLDGSTSTSFDGGPLTYQWSVNADSLPAAIMGISYPATTSKVQLEGGPGTYTFTLTVTDSAGNTAADSVTVVKQ